MHLVDAIDRGTPRGMRDAALVLLGYAGALTAQQLAALRIRDVIEAAAGVQLREPPLTLPHWYLDGEHRDDVCPACAPLVWARYLIGRGADPATALIRGVDQHQHVAGLDPQWTGKPAPDCQIDKRSLARAFTALVVKAGLERPERYGLFSLRSGGLAYRRRQGATLRELAQEGGLSPRSTVLLDYVSTAERWAAGDQESGTPPAE